MKEKEFITRLKAQTPPEKRELIEQAINLLNLMKKPKQGYYQEDITRAIEIISHLPPMLQAQEKQQRNQNTTNPDILLTTDFLLDKIQPWVELIRRELFNTSSPPFIKYEEMERWLAEQSSNQPHPSSIKNFKGIHSISYFDANNKIKIFWIFEPAPPLWTLKIHRGNHSDYTPINWLWNEIRAIAEATGFDEESLPPLILIGTKPVLPRYSISLSKLYRQGANGESFKRAELKINIQAKDMKFDELHEIYNYYRENLLLKRGKNFKQEHYEIYKLVSGKGGPVEGKGSVSFWECIRDEWNSTHKYKQFNHWKAVKALYDRTLKVLERRIKD